MNTIQALEHFHPIITEWFLSEVGSPTAAQCETWRCIQAKKHVLVCAPTGTGKTMAAFLWALHQLITGTWSQGKIRVVYVSPLRALNNDIRLNLTTPLIALEKRFLQTGHAWSPIHVQTRSGDTPQNERRRMLRHPPQILITTPESLNIMLASKKSRGLFEGVKTVILDEVHELAGSKRGIHLITAVERLCAGSGEFQRVALSATVRPLESIARWVGGWIEKNQTFFRRPVEIVKPPDQKTYDISIHWVQTEPTDPDSFWEMLAHQIKKRIDRNRSTLIFANSRRNVERLARLINHELPQPLVYAHHGSLSREMRLMVENRLKTGRLAGIVATNTLELGIDIGSIDEVILAATPKSVMSTIQRVGRAGHRVGQISRARLYAYHLMDLIKAAVAVDNLLHNEVEPLRPPGPALDVLAQVVLGCLCQTDWNHDDLYDFLRTCEPYQDLQPKHYTSVIQMLAGRYRSARISSLRPRISLDGITGKMRILPGMDRLLYQAGGTISDRGEYNLRLADTRTLLGTLDEEFVWERSPNDRFGLGVQTWQIQHITHNDVLVKPAGTGPSMAPFWRADALDSHGWLHERIGEFLLRANQELERDDFYHELQDRYKLFEPAAQKLIEGLRRQKLSTQCDLPHRRHLVSEVIADPQYSSDRRMIFLHTSWGGRVNRPLALALAAAWQQHTQRPIKTIHDDYGLLIGPIESVDPRNLLSLLENQNLDDLLINRLTHTDFFGAHFRQNAQRALLLPRNGIRKRTPLWLNRKRSKELLAQVGNYEDFPIVLETYRSCLQDEMDMDTLRLRMKEYTEGAIRYSCTTTKSPSPFASEAVWKQTNQLMYENDTPLPNLPDPNISLVRRVAVSNQLRPRIHPDIASIFFQKLLRIYPGYSPANPDELIEWLKETLWLSKKQWEQLLHAVQRDHQADPIETDRSVEHRVAAVSWHPDQKPVICCIESIPRLKSTLAEVTNRDIQLRIQSAMYADTPICPQAEEALNILENDPTRYKHEHEASSFEDLLGEWMRYQPPISMTVLSDLLAVDIRTLEQSVRALVSQSTLVMDELIDGSDTIEICHTENLERMLRISRAQTRKGYRTRSIDELPGFLASCHQLGDDVARSTALPEHLERLFGYPAPVAIWETDILPARLPEYTPRWLDELFTQSDLGWFGCGSKTISFCFGEERDLFLTKKPGDMESEQALTLFEPAARYPLADLAAKSGRSTTDLSHTLWRLAWRGLVSNDGFAVLRQGITSGFRAVEPIRTNRLGKSGLARWKSTRPFPGNWYRIDDYRDPNDIIESEELNRQRVRVLLDRYGLLFHKLLSRELPALHWSTLLRTLQLMELSGEVIAGHFFEHIEGLQFTTREKLRIMQSGIDSGRTFWLNAADPASACGLGLRRLQLPRRLTTSHLVYHGSTLALISESTGKRIRIATPPDHPKIYETFQVFKHLMERWVQPKHFVQVEQINSQPAAQSPYRNALKEMFSVETYDRTLRLTRKYS